MKFLLEIENKSDEIVEAELFGSLELCKYINDEENYEKDGITIKAVNGSYFDLLMKIDETFVADSICIEFIKGNRNQLNQILGINQKVDPPEDYDYNEIELFHHEILQLAIVREKIKIDMWTVLLIDMLPQTTIRIEIILKKLL
jgi:hypothetical protein